MGTKLIIKVNPGSKLVTAAGVVETSPLYRPATTGQHITFRGTLADAKKSASEVFTVLAGDGAPTPTSGFARWNVVSRPQRKGVTVLDGYDPMILDVPIRFDAVAVRGQDVEGDIQKLEWMGGRGVLFSHDGGVGSPARGDSPLVEIFSGNSNGEANALVPAQYQTSGLRWIVTGLAFDANPIKDRSGDRIRQDVTVTLTEFVSAPFSGSADSPGARANARHSLAGKFTYFQVTKAHNTIRKITILAAHNPKHSAAVAVLNANRSDKALRLGPSVDQDLTKHLPLGTKIRVPLSVIKS